MKFTNKHNLSLIAQVFLVDDDYDYVPNTISVTSLIKPVREIVLKKRVDTAGLSMDVSSLLASSLGSAIHTGIEVAWLQKYRTNLTKLGWTEEQIDRIVINPERGTKLPFGSIPVYFEQRVQREIDGITITGKFDCCFDGVVRDNKSTSTFGYTNGTNNDKYILQCSIYRWLNPDIMTEDYCEIDYYFTDWSKARLSDPNYPRVRATTVRLPLMPIDETEEYIRNRIALIKSNMEKKEEQIVQCNNEELWMGDPSYKYYSDPTKVTGRCTKRFSNPIEANAHKNLKGKGVIVTDYPKAKACNFCASSTICTQKDKLIEQGKLDYEED